MKRLLLACLCLLFSYQSFADDFSNCMASTQKSFNQALHLKYFKNKTKENLFKKMLKRSRKYDDFTAELVCRSIISGFNEVYRNNSVHYHTLASQVPYSKSFDEKALLNYNSGTQSSRKSYKLDNAKHYFCFFGETVKKALIANDPAECKTGRSEQELRISQALAHYKLGTCYTQGDKIDFRNGISFNGGYCSITGLQKDTCTALQYAETGSPCVELAFLYRPFWHKSDSNSLFGSRILETIAVCEAAKRINLAGALFMQNASFTVQGHPVD